MAVAIGLEEPELLGLGVSLLAKFLSVREPNLKYLALENMVRHVSRWAPRQQGWRAWREAGPCASPTPRACPPGLGAHGRVAGLDGVSWDYGGQRRAVTALGSVACALLLRQKKRLEEKAGQSPMCGGRDGAVGSRVEIQILGGRGGICASVDTSYP